MSLDDLGNIGDFLGGIGVVVTLIYLAFQIRQNTEQIRQNSSVVRAAAAASLAQATTTTTTFIAQDAEINRIFWEGLDAPESLSEAESRRFEGIASVFMRAFEQSYDLHRAGALPEESWESQKASYLWLADRRGFVTLYWRKWGALSPVGVRTLMDSAIRDAAA